MDASEDDSLFVEGGEEDHTPVIEKNYVYAIGSRTILRGMLLVIFSGKGLHVKVDSVLGWKTIGKAMTARVKETDSNERVYVTELGGRTPAEL